MSDLPDLPPELASLYAIERVEAHPPAGLRDEIRVAIGATLGISIAVSGTTAGAAGATAGGASGLIVGTTTKLVLVVAVAGAIGGGARVLLDREPPPTKPAAPVVEHRRVVALPRPSAPSPEPVAAVIATPPVESSTVAKRTSRSKPSAPLDQRSLVKQAWSALRRGEREQALVLVERALALGAGPLDEERDALHVHLLQQLGRADDASRLAREFHRRYPNSIHDGLITPAKESL